MSDQGSLFDDAGEPTEAAVPVDAAAPKGPVGGDELAGAEGPDLMASPAPATPVDDVRGDPDVDRGNGDAGGGSATTPHPGPADAAAVLAPWREAGVLAASDVHIATTLARLAGLGRPDDGALDADEAQVVLGVALAARAPRLGHVCLDLATVRTSVPAEVEGDVDALAAAAIDDLPWPPSIEGWRAALAGAVDLVAVAVDGEVPPSRPGRGLPLVLDGTLLYLERYRAYEDQVAAELLRRATASAAGSALGSAPVGGSATSSAGVTPAAAASAAPPIGEATSASPAGRSAFAGALVASPEQQRAAEAGAAGLLSVLVGGPGTGKTTTVATLLALLLEADPSTRIALVAPTGKAAARMGESIAALAATLRSSGAAGAEELADQLVAAEVSTIHRRLVWRPDGTFRHGRSEPLGHDVVIVDETSMVSLPLMAHLLDAVRPDARLVLVGDPGQLASVEAGSVLGDIAGPAVDAALAGGPSPAGPLADCVAVLTRSYRFPEGSAVGRFAAAVRSGDADAAVAVLAGAGAEPDGSGATTGADTASAAVGRATAVSASSASVSSSATLGADGPAVAGNDVAGSDLGAGVRLAWARAGADSETGEEAVRAAALDGARAALAAAEAGDAVAALEALGRVRVLCAHRRGPFGVAWWNWRFEGWLAADGARLAGSYVGRPVMVTANDALNGVANGDLGVIVAASVGPRLALPVPEGVRLLSPARLEAVETVHAMTIHKSQGSEFDEVVVVLPPPDSRLATRELLYTAVTRARKVVTLVGGEAALRRAIENRVVRQTGLRQRLWPASPSSG